MFQNLPLAACVLLAFFASACGGANPPVPGDYRPEDYTLYEGYVVTAFVYREPSPTYWGYAGWEISDEVKTAEELTDDCTLYPLANAVNQWTGMCAEEKVYIPAPGVVNELISLALVAPDGGVLSVNIHGKIIPVGE